MYEVAGCLAGARSDEADVARLERRGDRRSEVYWGAGGKVGKWPEGIRWWLSSLVA